MLYRYAVTMRCIRAMLVLLLTFCIAASASVLFASGTVQERKGQIIVDVNLKAPVGANDVRLWLPAPLSDADQFISQVTVTGNYTRKKLVRNKRAGGAALFAEWKGPLQERTLTYRFMVTRKEAVRKDFPTTEAAMPAGMRPYLATADLGTAEKRVREIAAAAVEGRTKTLDKARAVYDWVVANMSRDPNVKGCGTCEIDRLLSVKSGKCADISTVFVSLLRAAGVPAREVHGLRLHKEREGDITKFQHCWAEFFLPGYGWVPADPADVLKFKLEKDPTAGELKAKADYFFGAVDAYRVQFNTGDRVRLSPTPAAGDPIYFMYPYAEADGKPLNEDLYGFNIGYTIRFREQ